MGLFNKEFLQAWTVGLNFVISTVIGGFLGYGLDYAMDRWFHVHTSPWLLFIFTIFGIVAGFIELMRLAKNSDDKPDQKNP